MSNSARPTLSIPSPHPHPNSTATNPNPNPNPNTSHSHRRHRAPTSTPTSPSSHHRSLSGVRLDHMRKRARTSLDRQGSRGKHKLKGTLQVDSFIPRQLQAFLAQQLYIYQHEQHTKMTDDTSILALPPPIPKHENVNDDEMSDTDVIIPRPSLTHSSSMSSLHNKDKPTTTSSSSSGGTFSPPAHIPAHVLASLNNRTADIVASSPRSASPRTLSSPLPIATSKAAQERAKQTVEDILTNMPPQATIISGALLFVDMSGFTPLSEKLSTQGLIGVEALSKHLNDYFGPIVTCITRHGGDVIKFAGDALLVLFACTSSFSQSFSGSSPHPYLREACYRAVYCASVVHHKFSNFQVTPGVTLTLHSAVSCGDVCGVCVGGYEKRWEFLLKGYPITELGPAMHLAGTGQIVLTNQAATLIHDVIQCTPITEPTPKTPAAAAPHVDTSSTSMTETATKTGLHIEITSPTDEMSDSSTPSSITSPIVVSGPPSSTLTMLAAGTHVVLDSITPIPSIINRLSGLSMSSTIPSASNNAAFQFNPSVIIRPSSPSPAASPSHFSPVAQTRSLSSSRTSSPTLGTRSLSSAPATTPGSPLMRASSLSAMNSVSGSATTSASTSMIYNPNVALHMNGLASAFVPASVLGRIVDGQACWLAELRRITTLFVLLPEHDVTHPDENVRMESLYQFQEVVAMMMEVTSQYHGEIRQLITDDKGTVMILLFGLIAHANNPARGVMAALDIRSRMRAMGNPCAIGVTTGNVFCGTIGNDERCEFAVIGDRVNTAARLMVAVQGGDGILCDLDTKRAVMKTAGRGHGLEFTTLPSIPLKGKKEPQPVFEPRLGARKRFNPTMPKLTAQAYRYQASAQLAQNSPIQQTTSLTKESSVDGNATCPIGPGTSVDVPRMVLLGRDQEMSLLRARLDHAAKAPKARHGVMIVEGHAGSGKSVLLQALMEHARSLHMICLVGTPDDTNVTPYHAFYGVLQTLLFALTSNGTKKESEPPSSTKRRTSKPTTSTSTTSSAFKSCESTSSPTSSLTLVSRPITEQEFPAFLNIPGPPSTNTTPTSGLDSLTISPMPSAPTTPSTLPRMISNNTDPLKSGLKRGQSIPIRRPSASLNPDLLALSSDLKQPGALSMLGDIFPFLKFYPSDKSPRQTPHQRKRSDAHTPSPKQGSNMIQPSPTLTPFSPTSAGTVPINLLDALTNAISPNTSSSRLTAPSPPLSQTTVIQACAIDENGGYCVPLEITLPQNQEDRQRPKPLALPGTEMTRNGQHLTSPPTYNGTVSPINGTYMRPTNQMKGEIVNQLLVKLIKSLQNSCRSNVVLFMDDVHAMDSQSVTVLTTLINLIPSLLIILGARSTGPDCPQAHTLLEAATAAADAPLITVSFPTLESVPATLDDKIATSQPNSPPFTNTRLLDTDTAMLEHSSTSTSTSTASPILLKLGGLPRAAIAGLLCARLNVQAIDDPVLDFVLSKSAGSPMYVEQLVYSLLSLKMITLKPRLPDEPQSVSKCIFTPTVSIDTFQIPETLQDVIGGRIDSLTPSQQMVLKVCSVFGLEIDAEALFKLLLTHDLSDLYAVTAADGENTLNHRAHDLAALCQHDLLLAMEKEYSDSESENESDEITTDEEMNIEEESLITRGSPGTTSLNKHARHMSSDDLSTGSSSADESPSEDSADSTGYPQHRSSSRAPPRSDSNSPTPSSASSHHSVRIQANKQFHDDIDTVWRDYIKQEPKADRIYLFNHSLTRDVAYSRLPYRYERKYGNDLSSVYDKLAYHWQRIATCEIDKSKKQRAIRHALNYAKLAAAQAQAKSSHKETVTLCEQALALIPLLPGQQTKAPKREELEILDLCAPSYIAHRGFASSLSLYDRMLDLCESLRGHIHSPRIDEYTFTAIHGKFWATAQGPAKTGKVALETKLTKTLHEIAERTGDSALLIDALHCTVILSMFTGMYAQIPEYCERIIAIYDPEKHWQAMPRACLDTSSSARVLRAMALAIMGDVERAIRFSDHSLEYASSIGCSASIHQAYIFRCGLLNYLLNGVGVSEIIDDFIEQQRRYGFRPGFNLPHIHKATAESYRVTSAEQASELGDRVWALSDHGTHISTLSATSICQTLFVAKQWYRGLQFTSRWIVHARDGAEECHFYFECYRFRAAFFHLQAVAKLENAGIDVIPEMMGSPTSITSSESSVEDGHFTANTTTPNTTASPSQILYAAAACAYRSIQLSAQHQANICALRVWMKLIEILGTILKYDITLEPMENMSLLERSPHLSEDVHSQLRDAVYSLHSLYQQLDPDQRLHEKFPVFQQCKNVLNSEPCLTILAQPQKRAWEL